MMNKRLLIIVASVAGLLCIPLIAMQFSEEVFWTSSDFVIMGLLLLTTGLLGELALRRIKSKRNRIIVAALILLTFLFVWAELAVGIVGSPFAGN